MTRQPSATRLRPIAPPMMPSPMMPTGCSRSCLLIPAPIAVRLRRKVSTRARRPEPSADALAAARTRDMAHLDPRIVTKTGAAMSVTLVHATTIVDIALKKGRETNCAPLTVAVLDSGGHLVAFKREDRSGILRPDIAMAKAWGPLGMGFGTRELADRAQKMPMFVNALAAVSGGSMEAVPGGALAQGEASCARGP